MITSLHVTNVGRKALLFRPPKPQKIPGLISADGWESAQAATDYACGQAADAHSNAIAVDRAKTFHREKTFIRYHPLMIIGSVDGTNPLATDALKIS